MNLCKNEPLKPELARTPVAPESKEFKTYTIPTSRGEAFTVLNTKRKEVTQFVEADDSYFRIKPDAPYILASRQIKDTPSVIYLNDDVSIGGNQLALIAGPCSIESRDQMVETALRVKAAGAQILRAGGF